MDIFTSVVFLEDVERVDLKSLSLIYGLPLVTQHERLKHALLCTSKLISSKAVAYRG